MKFVFHLCLMLGVVLYSAAHVPEETTTRGTSSWCTEEPEQDCEMLEPKDSGNPIELGVFNGKLFSIGKTKMSWFDSINYCYERGLTPASVEDKHDFNFLAERSRTVGLGSNFGLWTGGNDIATPRHFTWFQSRLPLDTKGGFRVELGNSGQRCLIFEVESRPTGVKIYLNDYYCKEGGHALCEQRHRSSS